MVYALVVVYALDLLAMVVIVAAISDIITSKDSYQGSCSKIIWGSCSSNPIGYSFITAISNFNFYNHGFDIVIDFRSCFFYPDPDVGCTFFLAYDLFLRGSLLFRSLFCFIGAWIASFIGTFTRTSLSLYRESTAFTFLGIICFGLNYHRNPKSFAITTTYSYHE